MPESGQASENVCGNDIPAAETVGGDTDEFVDFDRIPRRKSKKKNKKAKETPTEEASTSTSNAPDKDSSALGLPKSQEQLRAICKIKDRRLTLDEHVLRCGEEGHLQPGMQQRLNQLLQDRSSGESQAEEMVGPSPPPKDEPDIQPTTSATQDMTLVVAEEDAGPSTAGQSSPTLGPGTQAEEVEAAGGGGISGGGGCPCPPTVAGRGGPRYVMVRNIHV